MRILAFDLASTTGVACGDAGAEPKWWTLRLGTSGKRHHGARFAQLFIDARKIVSANRPSLIVVEEPIASGAPGGNDRAKLAMGLRGIVYAVAFVEGIDVRDVAVSTIRKHYIGTGRAPKGTPSGFAKREVMRRCAEYGWAVANDNESDALALWHYAACRWGGRMSGARGGLFDRAARSAAR